MMATLFNVGRTDRVLRLLLGVGLGVFSIFVDVHPHSRWGLTLTGIAVILSGTCGICLTYRALGLSTKKENQKQV